jgi:hypothetical protein
MSKPKSLLLICLITLLSTLLLWLPFFGGFGNFMGFQIPAGGMKTIFANYDGPNYIVIAKTWYQKSLVGQTFSLPLPLEYYPAHFPGYPLLIWLLGAFLSLTQAMLASTLLTSMLAAGMFYLFLCKFKLSKNPFWLTLVFLFLPARYFIVRSVGAPEAMFVFLILAAFYFFRQKKYWPAAIFGALAQLTKTPGILLFAGFGLYLAYQMIRSSWSRESVHKILKAWPLALIPLTVLGVFVFYGQQTGDFWAYFHSGDNFHLTLFPYQAFNSSRTWLGQIWIEDMVWLYLVAAVGVVLLFKKKLLDLGFFALIYYLATLFVAHRDLSRYLLPAWPFFLIGYDHLLQKKEFKIAFGLVLPAIYFYSLNFIISNLAPIADWTPYL